MTNMPAADTREIERVSTEPKEDAEKRYSTVHIATARAAHLKHPRVPPGERLVERYVGRAMLRSATKQYAEDGTWFAELLTIPNVWGDGDTEAAALADLEAVLRHWIDMKMANRDGDIPVIDGVNLNVL